MRLFWRDRDGQDGSGQISRNHGTFGSPSVAVVVGEASQSQQPPRRSRHVGIRPRLQTGQNAGQPRPLPPGSHTTPEILPHSRRAAPELRSGGSISGGRVRASGEERVSCRFVRKPWFDGIPGTRDATVELGVTQSHCTSTGSLVDVADTGSPAWRAAALLPRHSAQVRGERDMTVPGTGGGRCCGDTPSCRPSDHRERAFG